MTPRTTALMQLLKPIKWAWSSSIETRKYIVNEARDKVRTVLPFLNEDETALALEWLDREKHTELWD